jgi:TRAP-type mannitol/chloroaromatic compound transport system permease small subunit
MPRSKSKRSRYQPPPKKKRKPSPRWFGWSILTIMGAGVLMIVLNYVGKMPGTGWTTQNWPLFSGLGLIGVGFVMATAWR